MLLRTITLTGIACLIGVPLHGQEENNPLSRLFKQLDLDGDGFVTAEEAGEKNAELFNRLIKLGDADQDQKLSFEEFSKALIRPRPAQPEAPPEAEPPRGPSAQGRTFNASAFFNRLDQNGDGKLEKSELPEQLRTRFEPLFEQAGKDSLTQEEFQSASREVFGQRPVGNPAGFAAMFDRMDRNQDGQLTRDEIPEDALPRFRPIFQKLEKDSISREEYVTTMQELRRAGAEGGPEGRRPAGRSPGFRGDGPPRVPAFLSKLDKDNNGKLSATELAFAVTLLEELDLNQDGELDLSELMGFRPEPGGPGMRRPGERSESDAARPDRPRRPEGAGNPERPGQPAGDDFAKRFFERFDADGDGFITKSEAPERLAENFASLDRNGDGKISLEEFQSGAGPRPRGRQD